MVVQSVDVLDSWETVEMCGAALWSAGAAKPVSSLYALFVLLLLLSGAPQMLPLKQFVQSGQRKRQSPILTSGCIGPRIQDS